jgi:uncharacterized damage-inducible protein DinB
MRPFAEMVHEVTALTRPLLEGVVAGAWDWTRDRAVPGSKDAVLQALDASTAVIAERMPGLSVERLFERHTPIRNRTERVLDTVLCFVDNEVHHRAQGYVYLRQLGLEPPPFYQR